MKGLILTVDADLRQDIALKVGTITDVVSVTANAVQVNAESPSLVNVIEQRSIAALPLKGRAFLELAELGAGAVNVAVSGIESNATGTGGGRPGMAVSIAGIREGSNDILFDGIPSTNDYQNMIGIQLTPDGLAEFKIQQGYFSAEYGLPVVINVVTKSGTNSIHGAVWEFLRNDKPDARRTFEISKGPLRHNQFGAAGGGPAIKNKLFWFGDYEGQQIRQLLGSPRAIVPTPAMLGGDFSSLSTPIVDPFTGQPFPNNSIPTNRISGFAQKYGNSGY